MICSDVAFTGSGLAWATMTSAGFVAFSDGTRTDFHGQTAAEMRMAAKGTRLVVAAQVGDRRDTLQLVDNAGRRWDSGVTAYGVNCLAVRPHALGWECTLVLGAGPSRAAGAFWGRVIVDDTLAPVSALSQTPIPIGATSQGFLGFDPSGLPIWTDVSRQSSFGGVQAALWFEADGWTIFQSRESIDRICAYEHATGRVYVVWTGHTEHAPRIAATPDGQVLAAINGYDIFVPREAFVPWSPIAPTIPSIGHFDQPLWVAPFKAWTDRADYGQTETPTNAMVLDLADPGTAPSRYAFLWEGVPPTPDTPSRALDSRLIGYYVSLEGGGSNPDVLAAFERAVPLITTAAIARQRPIYVTLDSVVDPDRWLAFLDEYFEPRPGLEVVPMPELYPIVGLDEDATVAAWDRLLGTLGVNGYRLAAATTLYTQSDFWPLALIVSLQPRIADLVRTHRLHLVAPFSVGRPSGVVSYPDVLGPILAQWGSAAPTGLTPPILVLPTPPTPAPAPTPPEPPQPTPDPPPAPPAEARTEVVMIGNQRVLMTPTEAAATRAAQQAAVDAFNPALRIKDKP